MQDIIPSYLTKDFLKRTLENGLQITNIEVDDFLVSSASGKGENYTSEILRVCVDYNASENSQQIFLILKNVMAHLDGDTKDCFNNMDIVKTEINMYTKLIPEFEKLLKNSTLIAPKCFAADREGQVLVLDDLKAMGYELQNRVKGLDVSHCILVMKKIAQIHATSMLIVKKDSKYAEFFNKPIFNEFTIKPNNFSNAFIFNLAQIIGVVKTWPDYETIVSKLENISSNFMDICFKHCKRKEGDLQVINHGDLWVNNMMFKYNKDNKIPLDVAFIDFQLTYYGSLGIDINYFLNTSPQLNVLKLKRIELLKIYYETLKSTLEQLNYSPIPSWKEVSDEVKSKEFYGFATLSGIFPIISMDKFASQNDSADSTLENLQDKIKALFGSERMIETLKYSLKRFDELGVLDV